jgi:signal transduction histidine kinase
MALVLPLNGPMRMLARHDLKFRLTMRIVAASVLCLVLASAYVLFDIDRAARARTGWIAELVARDLALQLGKTEWISGQASAFPELQTIATPLMAPGLCIGYRPAAGDILQRICNGTRSEGEPPALFTFVYGALFDPGREAASPVHFHNQLTGEAVAWVDPASLTEQAWGAASRLVAVMAATLTLLCCLVYAALARALRPTRLIRAGLERIAADDLSARLPPFDLAELSAIRDVFNLLAERLEQSLAERSELTRRLIALQDDERQHLARELHDEFGQCLAAIRALAASAGQTAQEDCPSLLPDCAGIERIAAQMTETLRGALFRLRPPDVEELGLTASLDGLVAGWNSRCHGRTRFESRLCAGLDDLPASLGAALYRIAQEGLTNAAKHAAATRVVLRLTWRGADIELAVEDDGTGEADIDSRPGLGLLGMQERVATLGGRLSFEASVGSVLRAVLPVAAECAA